VLTTDKRGRERVDRVGYEVCVLNALRDALRRREVWVMGADRYRDPDEDLPQDFEERRGAYYEELGVPLKAERFVEGLRVEMRAELEALDHTLPKNPHVRITGAKGGWTSLLPLAPLPAPPNLGRLRAEVAARWPMTGLLDPQGSRPARGLHRHVRHLGHQGGPAQSGALLCLYGLGTNTSLKRVSAGDPGGATTGTCVTSRGSTQPLGEEVLVDGGWTRL